MAPTGAGPVVAGVAGACPPARRTAVVARRLMAPLGLERRRIAAEVTTRGVEDVASTARMVSCAWPGPAAGISRRAWAGAARRHRVSSSSMRITWRACQRPVMARLSCIWRRRWLACASSPACSQASAISSSCCSWTTRVPRAATTRSRGSRLRSSSQVRVASVPTSWRPAYQRP